MKVLNWRIAKRILVVAHERPLKETRVQILELQGTAWTRLRRTMNLLETDHFDLVLLGHQSALPHKGIDQRIRERFPKLATLKIESWGEHLSDYPTRVIDSAPQHVVEALHEMLGENTVTPVRLP